MKNLLKIAYNRRTARKYGWTPEWFGAEGYNDDLINKIKEFQASQDLEEDGMVGPNTFRRIFTAREEESEKTFSGSGIICNGEEVAIEWDKVRYNFLPDNCYKKPPFYRKVRKPTMVVTHWDACLSADSCHRVLEKRGISTHFVIDNDGTIVQLVDCNNIGWHAGIRSVNNASVGIDFSNAVYTRYQKWYRRKGFGMRPMLTDVMMHGRVRKGSFLGYYPVQIQAYKALLKALHNHYGIPLECLMEGDELDTRVRPDAVKAKFKGVVNHYNLTARKWDAAGLELDKILAEIKEGELC